MSNSSLQNGEFSLKNLAPGAHIYLMGICGTAMGSLAGILKSMGFHVTGSDQNVYPPMSTQLENLGIKLHSGYRAENLQPRPDLVVVGNVISRTNPEADYVLKERIPYTSLPKAMGEFVIGARDSYVVAGTHGKTTTTSMLSWVSECCGMNPGFLIGGIPENFALSFRKPESSIFVIEGDEYDTAFFDKVPKFVHYRPRYVILTSVEFDHADIYADLAAVKSAFRRLIELIPSDGLLVCHSEDENIRELLPAAKCRVVTYGLENGDYRAVERMVAEGRNHFSVAVSGRPAASYAGHASGAASSHAPAGASGAPLGSPSGGRKIADVALKLFGEHNTLNALAVFALARERGWNLSSVLQGLASFQGVRRRQTFLGEVNGVAVVEDFAHHPTAVRLTIKGMRERFPGRRLIAVFEPRSATSRRKVFQSDYVEALGLADQVFVANAYDQTKISEVDRFSSAQLIDDLKSRGSQAHLGDSADDLVNKISLIRRTGDVVLIMSNGGFDGIYQKLLARL